MSLELQLLCPKSFNRIDFPQFSTSLSLFPFLAPLTTRSPKRFVFNLFDLREEEEFVREILLTLLSRVTKQ
ncbi:hypothetical protein FRX31_022786 [Thalictrum thalictroides]|uniref:Uncharacterized protein n=1 Tax=Thalictrum thalictroides TaxID=46969 RepID=A0A7J6VST8_THATH|nr:hypothetical protein FRX31_022786 [Thalictrum thalictroides]